MGELFDRFVVVDWSAAGRPVTGPDSIWIAVVDDRPGAEPWLTNPSTRRRAERALTDLVGTGRRTLVAVDASLGYPSGTARWFGLAGDVAWQAMWRHVSERLVDDDTNANDRFEVAATLNRRGGTDGPFWGRPASMPLDGLRTHKPESFPVPEYRLAERWLRAGGRRPASGWQLLGAGSVGGQTLTLLPVLYRFAMTGPVAASVEVWPFTTGLAAPRVERGSTVVAEVWPTAFDPDLAAHPVRDAAQVSGVARRLLAVDAAGELADWLTPALDEQVCPACAEMDDVQVRGVVEAEEGWVLVPPSSVRTAPAG